MRCSVLEAIERIAALGYEGIELMADVPHAWPAAVTEGQLDDIRRRLSDCGLELSNVNAFMMNAVQDFWHPSWIEPDAGFRRLRIEHTIAALRMARRLGAKCITTEPGGPMGDATLMAPQRTDMPGLRGGHGTHRQDAGATRAEAMDLFVAGLKEALRVAEAEEVLLLVEPEPGLLIENADAFLELAGRIDSPAFGLNFDVGHFYCVGAELPETIHRLSGFTKHYHVEDIAATRVHHHLIPGRGAIDFAAVLDAIRSTGYSGWLTVELYPYLDDPDSAGREAQDCLNAFLHN
jgi:sugar phosphate isomerase/epimerase